MVAGRDCDECEKPLKESDYPMDLLWDYTCSECGFKYVHSKREQFYD